MSYCVVLVTAPAGGEAQRLAKILLKKRLCACVNIIRGVDSFFWWEAKIDQAKESLLMIKTRRRLAGRLIKAVKKAHSYSVCEVIALPIVAGNRDYLDWIQSSCRKG